jgi:excisionase family DNA binding protein
MKAADDDNILVVDKKEAARRLGKSIPTIDRAIARGDLRVKRYGRRVLILKTELARFRRERRPVKAKDDGTLAVDIKETAKRLGMSVPTVERAIARGDLQIAKFGKRTLIPKTELARFLESLPEQPHLKPARTTDRAR